MKCYKPYAYQKFIADFIISHTEAGVFADMGLGKTVSTLTALNNIRWDWNKALIIAPKRTALETWPQEIEKWEHLNNLTYSVVMGNAKERLKAINEEADIYITSRDLVVKLVEYFKNKPWPFDCVVIDELSSFKNSGAKRFRALKKIRPRIERIIGLTGTPASNGYIDLWAECFLLDGGKALGRTKTLFLDTFFTPGRRMGHVIYDWKLKENAESDIQKRLVPLCVSMKTEDYLELPERLDIELKVEMPKDIKEMYNAFQKEQFMQIDDTAIDAVNAAALMTKLTQFSSGMVYDEFFNMKHISDYKLEALDELIEKAGEEGENVLLFYNFRHEKDRILHRYKDAVDINEEGAIKKWQEGKIKILLAHPASAGHGLNLQSGGAISIWYTLPTSLELYQQACKRLHRMGQTKVVRNYIMLTKDTYDEEIYYRILQGKEKIQNVLIESLKAKLKAYK